MNTTLRLTPISSMQNSVHSGCCGRSFALALGRAPLTNELFFTPSIGRNLYIFFAHSRNYGLPALPRAFFCL